MNLRKNSLLFSSLLFLSVSSSANSAYNNYNVTLLPLLPRVSLSGWVGTQPLGLADAMVPLIGNSESDLYADIQGKTGRDHAWLGGAGLGYRQMINCSNILGGYLFVDRNITADKNRFIILNPGIESLGTAWDFRANAYVPVSSKKALENSVFADTLGLPGTFFIRHQQFGTLFNFYEEVGPGADAEIGHLFALSHRLGIYGGGYYYHPQDTTSIKGIEGRVELALNRFATLLINDTFDNNIHNTFEIGVRLSAGGLTACPTTPTDVHNRLLDPIARNLGALGTGNGIPSVHFRDKGTTVLEKDNIWFFTQGNGSTFDPAAGENNCTYENPCGPNQFVQTTVDGIDNIAKDANFYLNPVGGSYPLSGDLFLRNGQSIFGRTPDYTQEAFGTGRPVLTGGLVLEGNNYVQAIQLFDDFTGQINGIGANNTSNITLDNVNIGGIEGGGDYRVAVDLVGVQNVTIINSTLNAFPHNVAVGLSLVDSSAIVDNSEINAKIQDQNGLNLAFGISATTSSLIVTRSNINAVIHNPISGFDEAHAIRIFGGSLFVDTSSLNTSIISPTDGTATAIGVRIENNGIATINNNIITVNGQAFLANATGISAVQGTANVSDNLINVTANSSGGIANAFAYFAGAGSTINTSNNQGTIQAIAPLGVATAARIDPTSGGTVNGNTDSFVIIP